VGVDVWGLGWTSHFTSQPALSQGGNPFGGLTEHKRKGEWGSLKEGLGGGLHYQHQRPYDVFAEAVPHLAGMIPVEVAAANGNLQMKTFLEGCSLFRGTLAMPVPQAFGSKVKSRCATVPVFLNPRTRCAGEALWESFESRVILVRAMPSACSLLPLVVCVGAPPILVFP